MHAKREPVFCVENLSIVWAPFRTRRPPNSSIRKGSYNMILAQEQGRIHRQAGAFLVDEFGGCESEESREIN